MLTVSVSSLAMSFVERWCVENLLDEELSSLLKTTALAVLTNAKILENAYNPITKDVNISMAENDTFVSVGTILKIILTVVVRENAIDAINANKPVKMKPLCVFFPSFKCSNLASNRKKIINDK